MAPIGEKKAGLTPSAPWETKIAIYFFAQKGGQEGSFCDFERAPAARENTLYIYYFYRFSKNFDRDPTAERWCDVYAVTTFFQICQN